MTGKKKIKDANYGTKTAVQSGKGIVDYNPDKMSDVVGGEKLTYDEYLEIQIKSQGKVRGSFQLCYYEIPLGFRGEVEKITKDKICFKRIFVEGMYRDGICFDGKEDHVWMDLKGFEKFKPGDSVSFWAEIYRYLKIGDGKIIDFGLRNPKEIKPIEAYELPSDDDLMRQDLELIVCENCLMSEQCSGMCLLPREKRKEKVEAILKLLKKSEA